MFMYKLFKYNTIIDYKHYENILEYIPTNNIKIINQTFNNHELLDCFRKYLKQNNKKKYFVSLSGGVDSMVIVTILKYLGCNVIAIHINYNNRNETKEEEKFLKDWCKYNNIKLYVKSIDNFKRTVKRSIYESDTRKIRFDFYNEILNTENTDKDLSENEILVGHHKDDIVENIV